MDPWLRKYARWAKRNEMTYHERSDLLGFSGLVVVVLAPIIACRDMTPAVTAVNLQREVGHEMAKKLHDICTVGYEKAQTRADIDRLNDGGCVDAAFALKTFRLSHALVVSMMQTYDAGRCTSLVNQAPRECNLTEALSNFVKAGQAAAVATQRIEAIK